MIQGVKYIYIFFLETTILGHKKKDIFIST